MGDRSTRTHLPVFFLLKQKGSVLRIFLTIHNQVNFELTIFESLE